MHNDKHLSRELLAEIVTGRKKRNAYPHILKCDICNEVLSIAEASFKIAKISNLEKKDFLPDNFDFSKSITQLYDNSISGKDAKELFNALAGSDRFFPKIFGMIQECSEPVESGTLINTNISMADMVLKARPPQRSLWQKILAVLKKTFDWVTENISGIKILAPRLAILATLVVVAFVSYDFYDNWNQQKIIMTNFDYKTKVPLDVKSSFRGTESISETSRFESLFKGAVGYYVSKKYQASVKAFSNLEANAENLTSKPEGAELLLDYYLYYGLSHLALLTSNNQSLSKIEKEQHGRSAIKLLLKAKDYAVLEGDNSQNINYFLGVAYWFNGEKEQAVINLKNVSESNEFYEKSQLLIGQ